MDASQTVTKIPTRLMRQYTARPYRPAGKCDRCGQQMIRTDGHRCR